MMVMNEITFKTSFKELDALIDRPLKLLVAGGGALLLGHQMPLSTHDIDAVPIQSDWTIGQVDQKAKVVATKLGIDPQWLNPYFSSFSYVLPKDYINRLVLVYKGKYLEVLAMGVEDLLILKCFSGRAKDISHARFLIRKCKNLKFVEQHLEEMLKHNIPKAQEALDFFDDVKDSLGK